MRRRAVLNAASKPGLGGAWPAFQAAGLQQPPSEGKYCVVAPKASGIRRLRLSGCYMKPQNCRVVQFVNEACREDVDAVCNDCKVHVCAMCAVAGEEPAASSSSKSVSSSA